MSWLVYAFSGPVLWALSTHLDKYLVERYFKSSDVAVLLVFTSFIGVITLPFIAYHQPDAIAPGLGAAALMAASGLLYMTGMLFYLNALQSEEASVVAPFYQAVPLISYALGYLVLGETLTGIQLAGGVLIIGGTLLVSLRPDLGRQRVKGRFVALMLTCALCIAVSSLIFKVFAVKDEFWPTTFWMFVGECVFGAALLAIPAYLRQFIGLLRSSPGAVLSINAANELINLGGSLGTRYALLLAPLSLVQAVGSTTTLFVFAFGVVFSLLFPAFGREDLSGPELMRKGVAAILVAAGTILVSH